jgi:hypothetical protein
LGLATTIRTVAKLTADAAGREASNRLLVCSRTDKRELSADRSKVSAPGAAAIYCVYTTAGEELSSSNDGEPSTVATFQEIESVLNTFGETGLDQAREFFTEQKTIEIFSRRKEAGALC